MTAERDLTIVAELADLRVACLVTRQSTVNKDVDFSRTVSGYHCTQIQKLRGTQNYWAAKYKFIFPALMSSVVVSFELERALILFIQTLALYKSFTYLGLLALTYNHC